MPKNLYIKVVIFYNDEMLIHTFEICEPKISMHLFEFMLLFPKTLLSSVDSDQRTKSMGQNGTNSNGPRVWAK